jgi:hypothetical protein
VLGLDIDGVFEPEGALLILLICIHLTRTEDSHVTEDGETIPVRVLHAYDCTCGEDCG